jgi:hypothetical protein
MTNSLPGEAAEALYTQAGSSFDYTKHRPIPQVVH